MQTDPFNLDLPGLVLSPPKIYRPAGRCIYCGVTSVPLSSEHILPFSLAGREILPESSCSRCAAITSEIERIYTRSIHGDLRIHLGLPTRRPKKRPKQLEFLRRRNNGSEEACLVSIKNHPFFAFFPVFSPPGLLQGVTGRKTFTIVKFQYSYFKAQAEAIANINGGEIGRQQLVYPAILARLVSKIGHSFAVANLGFEMLGYIPLLQDLIIGLPSSVESAPDVFGTISDNSEGSVDLGYLGGKKLHNITLIPEKTPYGDFLIAYVQLFAALNGPVYVAVVGRRETI